MQNLRPAPRFFEEVRRLSHLFSGIGPGGLPAGCKEEQSLIMASGFDPIIFLMVEIKNTLLSGGRALIVDHSIYRQNVLAVLKGLGLLSFKVYKEAGLNRKKIQIELNVDNQSTRRLKSFRIFSRPGRRTYLSFRKIKNTLAKRPGAVIVSTSQGVLEGKEAVKKSLGGEVLFEV